MAKTVRTIDSEGERIAQIIFSSASGSEGLSLSDPNVATDQAMLDKIMFYLSNLKNDHPWYVIPNITISGTLGKNFQVKWSS